MIFVQQQQAIGEETQIFSKGCSALSDFWNNRRIKRCSASHGDVKHYRTSWMPHLHNKISATCQPIIYNTSDTKSIFLDFLKSVSTNWCSIFDSSSSLQCILFSDSLRLDLFLMVMVAFITFQQMYLLCHCEGDKGQFQNLKPVMLFLSWLKHPGKNKMKFSQVYLWWFCHYFGCCPIEGLGWDQQNLFYDSENRTLHFNLRLCH